MATLTRQQATDMVYDCESRAELAALCVDWIGNDSLIRDEETKDWLYLFDDAQDALADYVSECCLDDDVRSNGPQPDDDTGIPA